MASGVEQLFERITKLPNSQKVAIIVAIVAAVTGANYFFYIDPQLTEFDKKVKRLRNLEVEKLNAQGIANNLAQVKRDKELLEQQLAKALTELPQEANIEQIVQSLYEIGTKSGLHIVSIEPQSERKQAFYAEIPIKIAVRGNYHEIGVFFDSVGKLKRIINITDIALGSPTIQNEQAQVQATYTATSFRFLSQAKKPADD